jgi:hypothetical protein
VVGELLLKNYEASTEADLNSEPSHIHQGEIRNKAPIEKNNATCLRNKSFVVDAFDCMRHCTRNYENCDFQLGFDKLFELRPGIRAREARCVHDSAR